MAKVDSLLGLSLKDFAALSDAKAAALATLANDRNRRSSNYAYLATVCGTLCFFSLIGAYVYLVMNGHPTEAYWALGTAALSIVSQLIRARL
jgi:predicted membrane protein